MYLLSFDLASHELGLCDHAVYTGGHMFSEGEIERCGFVPQLQPMHNFVPNKETELLVQIELREKRRKSAASQVEW